MAGGTATRWPWPIVLPSSVNLLTVSAESGNASFQPNAAAYGSRFRRSPAFHRAPSIAQPSLPCITSGGVSLDIASLMVSMDEDQSLAVTVTVTFGLAVWNAWACCLKPARMASPASEKPTFRVIFPYLAHDGSVAAALAGATLSGAAADAEGAVVAGGALGAVVAALEQPTTRTAASATAQRFHCGSCRNM